jgi:hypothetical protein
MKQYKLSFSNGTDKTHKTPRGSPREVRRDYCHKSVDKNRVKDNIYICTESIASAYDKVFGESVEAYNKKQKRADRKIDNYFEKLFRVNPDSVSAEKEILVNNNQQQSFYEWVIGVGNCHNAGIKKHPETAAVMRDILVEYGEGLQARNPNIYFFQIAVHMDESTPHLHIEGIPFSDGYTRGMSRQQGMDRAYEAMGFTGLRETYVKQWQIREREELKRIAREHGIEIAPEEESRGVTLTKEAYIELDNIKQQITQAREELAETSQQKDTVREQLAKAKRDLKLTSLKVAGKTSEADKIIAAAQAKADETIAAANEYFKTHKKEAKDENDKLKAENEGLKAKITENQAICNKLGEMTSLFIELEKIHRVDESNPENERLKNYMRNIKYPDGTTVFDGYQAAEEQRKQKINAVYSRFNTDSVDVNNRLAQRQADDEYQR